MELPLRPARKMQPSRASEVIASVHEFIEEERRRSFNFLGQHSHQYMKQDELLVVSSATIEEIEFLRRSDHDGHLSKYRRVDWFTFVEPLNCNGVRYTVAITLPQDAPASIEQMTVTVHAPNNVPTDNAATAWLRETYDWDDLWGMKFREQQLEEQRLWWTKTGKSFDLLALPGELRNKLYMTMIGSVILPDLCTQIDFGHGLVYKDKNRVGRNLDPDIEAPNMQIVLLNKKVRQEALSLANKEAFKRLRAVGPGERSTAVTKPDVCITELATTLALREPRATFLRNVQLEMSAAAYFESIGERLLVNSTKNIAFQPHAGQTFYLNRLADFPALKNLDFRFIGPKHPDAICPWYDSAKPKEHSCQKVWIEWFFALGFTKLMNLRQTHPELRFSLSGCVKTSSKTYWERVLNDKHVDHMSVVWAKRKEIRQKKRDNAMLKCECTYKCDQLGWEAMGKTYEWDEEDFRKIKGLDELVDSGYWSFAD